MRNVAANFKVLDIGSHSFDQVCVFFIVFTLNQKKLHIVALRAQNQNTQNIQKRPQITSQGPQITPKSPPEHPRTCQ